MLKVKKVTVVKQEQQDVMELLQQLLLKIIKRMEHIQLLLMTVEVM